MPRKAPQLATFRFYGELRDFLDEAHGSAERTYRFHGNPSVKDAIEAQGVPHTEVGLILVNGEPSGFEFKLAAGDRIAVYPFFSSLDLGSSAELLRPA